MAIHPPLLHRLDALTLYTYSLPLKNGKLRQGLLLHNAATGSWGEAAPLPHRSPETLIQAKEQLLSLFSRSPTGPLFPSVRFCLEGVLQPLSLPLSVPIWALYDYHPSVLSHAKSRAYTHVKIKIGTLSPSEAKKAIHELSGAFHLRIDCNRAFSYLEALEIFSHFDNDGKPFCVEEPTSELNRLPHIPFPFALDETLEENPHFPIDQCPHLTTLILKPTLWGGTSGCAPLVQRAQLHNKEIIFTGAYESGIGTLQIASMASSTAIQKFFEEFDPSFAHLTTPEKLAYIPHVCLAFRESQSASKSEHKFLEELLNCCTNPVGIQTYQFLAADLFDPPLDLSSPTFVLNSYPNIHRHLIQEIAHGTLHPF